MSGAAVARAAAPGPGPAVALDHLVVACRSLDAGAAWCEATFGVAAAPGGRHALMGTHNLLLALASARFANAYLELIAIDPDAPAPARPRWFDLDDASLRAAIAAEPRLVHWVARSDDLDTTVAQLRAAGHDPGRVVAAERMTPRGLLRWRITLPGAGRRPAAGAVPALIQWGDVHPTESMPASGVSLDSLEITGIDARLADFFQGVTLVSKGDPLVAHLTGARGKVRLVAPREQIATRSFPRP